MGLRCDESGVRTVFQLVFPVEIPRSLTVGTFLLYKRSITVSALSFVVVTKELKGNSQGQSRTTSLNRKKKKNPRDPTPLLGYNNPGSGRGRCKVATCTSTSPGRPLVLEWDGDTLTPGHRWVDPDEGM